MVHRVQGKLSRLAGMTAVVVLLALCFLLVGGQAASLNTPGITTGPGLPVWTQVNENGFGDPENAVVTLDVFDGRLYAGTWNNGGAEIWRAGDDLGWTLMASPWPPSTTFPFDAQVFGPDLYVSLSDDLGVSHIWRTDGNSWTQALTDLAGDAVALGVFSDSIYAAGAGTVWRSATGDLNDWQTVAAISGTQPTMEVYGDHLYAGFCSTAWGAGLWRTDGVSWTAVFTNGLGTPRSACLPSMAEFQDYLYIGLWNFETGAQVWRSGDGLDWSPVFTGGLGTRQNRYANGLIVFADSLYLAFRNGESGAGVWRSSDGDTWEQVNENGWGDPNNGNADFWDKGAAVFGKSLYIGTWKDGGGEVWQLSLAYPIYLPLVASGHTP